MDNLSDTTFHQVLLSLPVRSQAQVRPPRKSLLLCCPYPKQLAKTPSQSPLPAVPPVRALLRVRAQVAAAVKHHLQQQVPSIGTTSASSSTSTSPEMLEMERVFWDHLQPGV